MAGEKLTTGLSEEDSKRVEAHLGRLIPHLQENRFVVVGGLAIRYLLAKSSLVYPDSNLNDLDIIVEDLNVVLPTVIKDFLVYHFHHEGDKVYWALVDPVTKTKIDIFDYAYPPLEVELVQLGDYKLKVLSVEDQLVKTMVDVLRISPQALVGPKQFREAELLMQIVNLGKAERFWKDKKLEGYPESIVEAWHKALQMAKEHPEWLRISPFKKDAPYTCQSCVSDPNFPITPMTEIYKILGYVE